MLTMNQIRQVKHGHLLTREDLQALNEQGSDLSVAASWARQYYQDEKTEEKRHNQFCRDAY